MEFQLEAISDSRPHARLFGHSGLIWKGRKEGGVMVLRDQPVLVGLEVKPGCTIMDHCPSFVMLWSTTAMKEECGLSHYGNAHALTHPGQHFQVWVLQFGNLVCPLPITPREWNLCVEICTCKDVGSGLGEGSSPILVWLVVQHRGAITDHYWPPYYCCTQLPQRRGVACLTMAIHVHSCYHFEVWALHFVRQCTCRAFRGKLRLLVWHWLVLFGIEWCSAV